jgi:hypothetical protein
MVAFEAGCYECAHFCAWLVGWWFWFCVLVGIWDWLFGLGCLVVMFAVVSCCSRGKVVLEWWKMSARGFVEHEGKMILGGVGQSYLFNSCPCLL